MLAVNNKEEEETKKHMVYLSVYTYICYLKGRFYEVE